MCTLLHWGYDFQHALVADSIVHLDCGLGSLSLFNTKREGDRASGEGQGVVEVAAMTSLKERAVYWMVGIALVVLVNKALDLVDWLKR